MTHRLRRRMLATLGAGAAMAVAGCAAAGPVSIDPGGAALLVPASASTSESCRTLAPSADAAGVAPLDWFLPADPADRAVLDRWCAMVGPALVRAAPTRDRPAAAATTTSEAVAVLSWNTHVGAGDVVRLVRDLREGRLTAGRAMHGYVLLLQEVVRVGDTVPRLTGAERLPRSFPAPRPGFDVESVARTLGAALAYAPSMRNSTRLEDRGVAVLSSLPIEGVRIVELPLERQRRAAVVARLRNGLAVASVHFDTAAGLMAGGPGATRHRQARAIVEALSEEPAPLVIGGDLNTWWGDDEPAVKALRAVFPDAIPAPVRWTWAGPLGLTAKLDYVFARTNGIPVPVRRLPDRYGSDHYPLLALVPGAGLP